MRLKLGHRDITVMPLSPELAKEFNCEGLWEPASGTIHVEPSREAPEQALTTLHELLHAIWADRGLGYKASEESAVDMLSRGLASVFRDNPEFLGVLHQALANGASIV